MDAVTTNVTLTVEVGTGKKKGDMALWVSTPAEEVWQQERCRYLGN
jgi:hypothetical protein